MTPRTLRLIAHGIVIAARREYNLALDVREAELLARGGSIRLALEQLGGRLRVRRAVPGRTADDHTFQRRLAVAEVAADLSGAFDGGNRHQLITSLIEREASLRAAEESLAASRTSVLEVLGSLQAQATAYGKFGRYAHRLYGEQRAALEMGVTDDALRRDALTELDETYRRYLSHAARFAVPGDGPPEAMR